MEGRGRYGLQSHIYCINYGKVEVCSPIVPLKMKLFRPMTLF